MGRDIGDLWEDGGIKKTYERRNEFQLDDSAPQYVICQCQRFLTTFQFAQIFSSTFQTFDSFFAALNRINQPDYIPTETDVLRSRVKTTGIVEMDVVFDGVTVKYVHFAIFVRRVLIFIIFC